MDTVSLMRALAALSVVMGLLLVLYWGLRRFSNIQPGATTGADLRISHWKQIDTRRKLAVIEWGDDEHLVLLGTTTETLIASRAKPASPAGSDADETKDG